MTGSLTGALKGAAMGFVGGAVGGAVTSVGGGLGQGIAKGLKLVGDVGKNIAQGINAGLTGGIMGKITGGSFSKGFKTALIGFGAFKGLDALTGGAITRLGQRVADMGRSFFGTDTRALVSSGVGKEYEDLTSEEKVELKMNQRKANKMLSDALLEGRVDTEASTINGVAKKALKLFGPITKHTGVELSAAIRPSMAGGYTIDWGTINVGNYTAGTLNTIDNAVAYFHTHPGNSVSFSVTDVNTVLNEISVPLFMGSESGLRICDGSYSCGFHDTSGVSIK